MNKYLVGLLLVLAASPLCAMEENNGNEKESERLERITDENMEKVMEQNELEALRENSESSPIDSQADGEQQKQPQESASENKSSDIQVEKEVQLLVIPKEETKENNAVMPVPSSDSAASVNLEQNGKQARLIIARWNKEKHAWRFSLLACKKGYNLDCLKKHLEKQEERDLSDSIAAAEKDGKAGFDALLEQLNKEQRRYALLRLSKLDPEEAKKWQEECPQDKCMKHFISGSFDDVEPFVIGINLAAQTNS
jgi:hypothetical protein